MIVMDDSIIENLQCLYEKFSVNPYAIDKFIQYLNNSEDYVNQQIVEKRERDERRRLLEEFREIFIKDFLRNNNYLYIPDSSLFVQYDGEDYILIQEDIIWSKILTQINIEKNLLPWKQRVRMELLMQIRKSHVTNTIPESCTIQKVLRIMTTSIVPNKDYAKYFLTVLGDAILRKPTSNTHLTDGKITTFVDFLQYELNKFVKNNITTLFKTKYHNHEYKDLRLLPLHQNIDMPFLWEHLIKQNALNIIAVACHYSNRYEYADKFVEQCTNHEMKSYVFMLKNTSKEEYVKEFKKNMLQTSETLYMNHKEMLFAWKQYLTVNNLQNIMFYKEFYDIIGNYYKHSDGIYLNVTCESINYVKNFNSFMNDTMTLKCYESESDYTIGEFEQNINKHVFKYEVSELVQLFNLWLHSGSNNITTHNTNMNEELFIQLLQHFYDNFIIEDNRFVINCSNTLWNKKTDTLRFLHEYCASNDCLHGLELYEKYCQYVKVQNNIHKMCVSKEYFDYIYNNIFTPV